MVISSMRTFMASNIRWSVGRNVERGDEVLFWHQRWASRNALTFDYPDLFHQCSYAMAKINEIGELNGNAVFLNITCCYNYIPPVVFNQLSDLLQRLASVYISTRK
ncbi:hypothetical protein AMTR_s00025p00078870 [Amborella trichopoda]|uniref:Uncharacterized protein n=1 Tax=Amborella trichopoda TaxID=13333 RepID=W1PW50_AMBTC|nr:hypothetical protein AMTR_s00025p00078870 [Amborella trichopoda]